jgi:predicted nucleotidyltransferase
MDDMNTQGHELEQLVEKIRHILPRIKEEYSVDTLEVFGSYVRAEEGPDSDLDLLVTFTELPGLYKYIALENVLTDYLGVKVDLVMKDSLKPAIGERILKEAMMV